LTVAEAKPSLILWEKDTEPYALQLGIVGHRHDVVTAVATPTLWNKEEGQCHHQACEEQLRGGLG